jgi:hypothetical protein
METPNSLLYTTAKCLPYARGGGMVQSQAWREMQSISW